MQAPWCATKARGEWSVAEDAVGGVTARLGLLAESGKPGKRGPSDAAVRVGDEERQLAV